MLFPIGDDDRRLRGTQYVTVGLVLVNLFVFFFLQGMGANEGFTYGWSVIPVELVEGVDLVEAQEVQTDRGAVEIPQAPGPTPIYLTVLSAMFMHGGWLHLFGNVLYLWIFGDNLEFRFGALAFLGFYLACGVVATVAQVLLDPDGVVPNLGASGAISGVLGGYIVLFPRNRVHVLFFYMLLTVPAIVAIGVWVLFQFVNGLGAVAVAETVGGVAYGAHIGGFACGVVLALLLRSVFQERVDHYEEWWERERR